MSKINAINNSDNINRRHVKTASYLGSAIGIATAVAGIYKCAKKGNPNINFKNLTYSEKDILLIGAGSIAGGLTGGLITDKNKENRNSKIKEGIQQFFGSLLCPLGVLAVSEKLLEKSKFKPEIKTSSKLLNNTVAALPKIIVTAGSLIAGMNIGNKLVNKVNNKIFKENDKHEVKPSDYLVHTDDLCVAVNLILKDVKSIATVTSKILPAAFILCGAKTGLQEKQEQ